MFEGGPQKCFIHGNKQKDGHVEPFVVEFPTLQEDKLVKKNLLGKVIGINKKYVEKFEKETLQKVREWDSHCIEFKHKLDVSQVCHHCGIPNVYFDMPYPEHYMEKSHTTGSGIVLVCKECKKPCI